MTERTATRFLVLGTALASTVLVVAVRLFDAADEVLVFGTMAIICISSLTAGLTTGLDSRRND